jgi:hypothetical protein
VSEHDLACDATPCPITPGGIRLAWGSGHSSSITQIAFSRSDLPND